MDASQHSTRAGNKLSESALIVEQRKTQRLYCSLSICMSSTYDILRDNEFAYP